MLFSSSRYLFLEPAVRISGEDVADLAWCARPPRCPMQDSIASSGVDDNGWFSDMLDQLRCGLLITDSEARICYANPTFSKMSGYSKQELLGRTPRLLQSGQTSEGTYDDLRRTTRRGEPWSGNLLNLHRSGHLYWESLLISPVRDHEGTISHFVGIARDVTTEHEALRAKDLRESIRRHEERDELLKRIAGGLAHHLNNMLTVMVGNSALALRTVCAGSPAHEHLHNLEGACKQVAGLTARFLLSVGISPCSLELLDLREIVEDGVAAHRLDADLGVSIVTSFDHRPVLIDGNRELLMRLVHELLENAVDACREQRQQTIRVSIFRANGIQQCDDELRFVYGSSFSNAACIEIADNGGGMPRHVQQRAFEPFFSTKFLGRGLGLPAVLAITQLHHGAFTLSSRPDYGTAARFFLPCAEGGPQ